MWIRISSVCIRFFYGIRGNKINKQDVSEKMSYFIFYWDCEPYDESIKRVDTKKEAEQAGLKIIEEGGLVKRIIYGKLVDFDCKWLVNGA